MVGERQVDKGHVAPDKAILPGDHMLVIHDGLARVRAGAVTGSIRTGDTLAVDALDGPWIAIRAAEEARGNDGSARVLGMALEPTADGEGLMWVMVKTR